MILGVDSTKRNRIDLETRSKHGRGKVAAEEQDNNKSVQRGECGMVCRKYQRPLSFPNSCPRRIRTASKQSVARK